MATLNRLESTKTGHFRDTPRLGAVADRGANPSCRRWILAILTVGADAAPLEAVDPTIAETSLALRAVQLAGIADVAWAEEALVDGVVSDVDADATMKALESAWVAGLVL